MNIRKILRIYSKSENATWQLWTAHLAPKKKLFYSESEESLTITITSAELRDL